jgi:hypothetical protein
VNDSLPPPAWVVKRDGQLVPFEADKISRALFAATEDLGRPDAFLARELADGVVHFLSLESEGVIPTTMQVAEVVFKVVRELGQPALAEAFAQHGRQRLPDESVPKEPAEVAAPRPASPATPTGEVVLRFAAGTPLSVVVPECLRGYTLQTVFTRDLVAAQSAGLLTLTGLEQPAELAACVLGPPRGPEGGLVPALEELRRFVGRFAVVDGPEHLLSQQGRTHSRAVREFVRELALGLRLTNLQAIVNLNSSVPPSWAGDLAEGPLFAAQQRAPHAEQMHQLAQDLVTELLQAGPGPRCTGRVRIDWHLGEPDFATRAARQNRLAPLVRLAVEGAPLTFVFDRSRRPLALAEGVDRQHPAVLLAVGLHLPCLAAQSGVEGDPAKFLQKLGSLARLALSAAVQKREYLRRSERTRPVPSSAEPAVTSGFLLDRARLLVAPVGLDSLVYRFMKKGLCAGGAALDFGRQVVQRLRDVLRQDGRNCHLDTCVDGPCAFRLAEPREPAAAPTWPVAEDVVGLTPWDATAPLKNQLRAAGVLHAVTEQGTLALCLPDDRPPVPEQVLDWLEMAWRQTDVVRLRLVRGVVVHQQLTLPPVTSSLERSESGA